MTDNDMNLLFDNARFGSSADGTIPDEVIRLLMERMASSASDQQESEEQATPAADGRRSTKSEEKPDETDLRASLDTLRDLFAEAFPGDDEISQVTRVARDLKNDDTASAPDAEQNAQYADTIE